MPPLLRPWNNYTATFNFFVCFYQELHQAFLDSECVERKDLSTVPPLSDAALSSIRSILSERSPRLTHALLRFLKHTNASSVFLQHLLVLMEEKEGKRNEGWAERVCSALALAPCAAVELEQLWPELWRARDGPLSEERVMGRLLRPQSQTLLMCYCATALQLSRDRLLQDTSHTPGERSRNEHRETHTQYCLS